MKLIYRPKGRANEYGTLALNIYRGCGHRCTYCYVPSATFRSREDFYRAGPRKDYLKHLEREAAKWAGTTTERVFLCFSCDPYQEIDVELQHTRRTIEVLHQYGLHVTILTKGGLRALRDLDLLTPADQFGTTLTFLDKNGSWAWEEAATTPTERVVSLKTMHAAGIPTWVSLEPVIDPAATLRIIEKTHRWVDEYRVGPLNYHPYAKAHDWGAFAQEVVALGDLLGVRVVLKRDLAKHLPAGSASAAATQQLAFAL